MQRVERYLTPMVYRHIVGLNQDLTNKIELLNTTYQKGGDRVEAVTTRLDQIGQFIKSGDSDPKVEEILKPLLLDLQSFNQNIKNVMSEIESLDSDSKFIDQKKDTIRQIEDQYLDFLSRAVSYRSGASANLSHIIGSDGRSTFTNFSTDKDELDLTGLLEMFRPFITSFETVTRAIRDNKDITTVLDIIRDQSAINTTVMREAQKVLRNLIAKLDTISRRVTLVKYEIGERSENNITYRVDSQTATSEYNIALQTTDVYDYMVEIDFTSDKSDSLDAIKFDNLTAIQEYLDLVGKLQFNADIKDHDLKLLESQLDALQKADRPDDHSEIQTGGNYATHQEEIQNVTTHRAYTELYELTSGLVEINKLLTHLKNQIFRTKVEMEKQNNYLMYMAQVGMMGDIRGMNIYRYINRGILDYYRSIIEDIFDRIAKLGPETRPSNLTLTNENRSLVDAEYFRSYHHHVLKRMQNFIEFLVQNLNLKDVINIRKCTGPIFHDFVIFNHFKEILDSYYEEMQNKVSIYARINDYGTPGLDIPAEKSERVFTKDLENRRMVSGKYSVCMVYTDDRAKKQEMRESEPVRAKFNMVFDDEYPDNESISKYMSISTNISKKKGVMILTYGYSGTGKTFTLFGKKPQGSQPGKKGLLQSAIEGIRARSDILFRAYEMYGAGLVYPFYWCKTKEDLARGIKEASSVTEEAYYYEVDGSKVKSDHRIESLSDYVGVDSDIPLNSYVRIPEKDSSTFFANFSQIVESIDSIRKEKGRIKATPNNPESSRSIIVYDMLIGVADENGDELVKLTVIDLPGREEIVTTYTDDYIAKHPEFNTPYDRAVLSSMAINPLYLSILCPNLVFEAFNNLNSRNSGICSAILDQKISLKSLDNCLKEEYPPCNADRSNIPDIPDVPEVGDVESGNVESGDVESENKSGLESTDVSSGGLETFYEEVAIRLTSPGGVVKPTMIKDLVEIRNGQFVISNNPHFNQQHRGSTSNQIRIKRWQSSRQIPFGTSEIQYAAVIAIHLLNRIILMRDVIIGDMRVTKFDILESIYAYIADRLNYSGLSELAIAPFEGVYINENIVGLMKVLTTNQNLLNKSEDLASSLIEPQTFRSFGQLKREIRLANIDLYSANSKQSTEEFENVHIDIGVLQEIYRSNRLLYKSQRIFRFCNPEIEKVMNYYIEPEFMYVPPANAEESDRPFIRKVESREEISRSDTFIGPTKDIKVFYLFSNNKQEIKCEHQYKLYQNTQGLMQIIDPVNN